MPARRLTLRLTERRFEVESGGDGSVLVDGVRFSATAFPDGSVRVDDGVGRRAWALATGTARWVFLDGRSYEFEVETQGSSRKRSRSHHGALTAPMPATVRRLDVKPGDSVRKGQTLIILEAMKMELPVRAVSDGTITTVNCREGELVQPGATLVELDETD